MKSASGRKFRATASGYTATSEGRVRSIANYELAVGKLATMMDVYREADAMLLFGVLKQAIADIAMVSAPDEFEEGDFVFNICEAAGFLLGYRGSLYMDALGIDVPTARAMLERYLAVELDRAKRWVHMPKAVSRVKQAITPHRPITVNEIAAEACVTHVYARQVLLDLMSSGVVERRRVRTCKGNGVQYEYVLKEAA